MYYSEFINQIISMIQKNIIIIHVNFIFCFFQMPSERTIRHLIMNQKKVRFYIQFLLLFSIGYDDNITLTQFFWRDTCSTDPIKSNRISFMKIVLSITWYSWCFFSLFILDDEEKRKNVIFFIQSRFKLRTIARNSKQSSN